MHFVKLQKIMRYIKFSYNTSIKQAWKKSPFTPQIKRNFSFLSHICAFIHTDFNITNIPTKLNDSGI